MNNPLLLEIKKLQKTPVQKEIKQRLLEFDSFKKKNTKQWFSELCFCILTANSKASTALQIQEQLGETGFCNASLAVIKKSIRSNKHRFYNNKANFIVSARKHIDIKPKIQGLVEESGEINAREWLVKNVRGLGYKESSHFLRNVGYKELAILDRHVLNLLLENDFIKEKPKILSRKTYLELEKKFNKIAFSLKMSPAEADLYFWFLKTGKILK